jgi:hypothetical protein
MQQFAPLEELFKCRHFDQEIVVLCVRWYLSFKLSSRPSGHDGRAGHRLDPYDDYAQGTALYARI